MQNPSINYSTINIHKPENESKQLKTNKEVNQKYKRISSKYNLQPYRLNQQNLNGHIHKAQLVRGPYKPGNPNLTGNQAGI